MKVQKKRYQYLKLISFTVVSALIVGVVVALDPFELNFNIDILDTASRTMNTYLGALITAMALIITLTSNLYSPKLSKLFVSHPVTIFSMIYILITNLFILVTNSLNANHPGFEFFLEISFFLTINSIFLLLPFFYLISRFVRPSYFVRILSEQSIYQLKKLHRPNLSEKQMNHYVEEFFDIINIINNMASTAIQRSDKATLKIVTDELFMILNLMIEFQAKPNKQNTWRIKAEYYTPGLSDEGRYYLKKYKTWPEAYILSKVLENTNAIDVKNNELLSYTCRALTNSNDIALGIKNSHLVELITMILNSILNSSLENFNEIKFSSALYYYRINTELVIDQPELRRSMIGNLIYYGNKALELEEWSAARYFIYDLGRVLHYLAFENEELAIKVYQTKIKKIWTIYIDSHSIASIDCKRSIIKGFWILYTKNYTNLSNLIRKDFLSDNFEHAKILKGLIEDSNPLNREYNDTLVKPEYFSGLAYNLAKDFLGEFEELQ